MRFSSIQLTQCVAINVLLSVGCYIYIYIYIYTSLLLSLYLSLSLANPVGWSCGIRSLYFCRRVRPFQRVS